MALSLVTLCPLAFFILFTSTPPFFPTSGSPEFKESRAEWEKEGRAVAQKLFAQVQERFKA